MSERAITQRRTALDKANEVRLYRAAVKRKLAGGEVSIADVLRDCDPMLGSMTVAALLARAPRLGPARIRRALTANQIGPAVTLAHLSASRREQLIAWLADEHPAALGSAAGGQSR